MNDDGYPTLFGRSNNGKAKQWTIFVKDDYFWTEAGDVGGKITKSKPNYCESKNVGKANKTTPQDQAHLEAFAKYLKKKKEGYTEFLKDIDQEGHFEPMLAKQFEDYADKVVYPIAEEDKLNGIRCVIHMKGGRVRAFSRKGEEFHCLDHILDDVASLFMVFPDLVLDGELYNPKLKNELNKIASLVSVNRKAEDVTAEDKANAKLLVEFHVYDAINYDTVTKSSLFVDRKKRLEQLLLGLSNYVFYHGYRILNSRAEVEASLKKARKEKREGIMLKVLNGTYENKRSKFFLKYKVFYDEEFEILGFREGAGNWAGCVKNVICKLNKPGTNGETEFDSNIRGTMAELADLWKNRKKFVGMKATVEFQEYSVYNIPLIPYTQLPFRNYE